jgi:hypothetical protein
MFVDERKRHGEVEVLNCLYLNFPLPPSVYLSESRLLRS